MMKPCMVEAGTDLMDPEGINQIGKIKKRYEINSMEYSKTNVCEPGIECKLAAI